MFKRRQQIKIFEKRDKIRIEKLSSFEFELESLLFFMDSFYKDNLEVDKMTRKEYIEGLSKVYLNIPR